MSKEMLINVSEGEECRIALVEDGKLEELYMERSSSTSHVGNIYKGKVTNVEPSIQAAFIDFGLGRNGFLHISDLMPSYFGQGGDDIHESVGRKLARRDRPPIQRCLRRGDEIIVQIIKEGIGTKGPTLTTYLSVPGRILVMMPGMGKLGVSKKIEDEVERRRLRQILDSLKPPKDVGFIIRTAGIGKSKAEIQRDLLYLTRLWMTFVKKRDSGPGPLELYTEGDLVTRTVRDVFTTDIDRIIVDNKDVAKRVKDVIKLANPRTKNKVILFEEPVPLFHHYGMEREIEQMYSRHVPLPSGGSLVIDSTEAIVAIDVNSGKFRDHSDAETTAFKTDMEAADEIPRQLRLRDLGGVIICDFIDLRYERHRRELEARLHENFQKDRAKTKVLRMSQFGIIELTRQRMRPSLKRSIYFDCPHCKGAGLVKTPESMGLDVMRRLAMAINDLKVARVELTVCPDVEFYLQNKNRGQLAEMEAHFKKRVLVKADAKLGMDEMKLDLFDLRDSLVFLEQLGMQLPAAPHTTQLGTRRPPQQGRQDQGRRGGGGRIDNRRGNQQRPPQRPISRDEEDREHGHDIDSVEDEVERREEDLAADGGETGLVGGEVEQEGMGEDQEQGHAEGAPMNAASHRPPVSSRAEPIGEGPRGFDEDQRGDGRNNQGGDDRRPGRRRRGRRGGRGRGRGQDNYSQQDGQHSGGQNSGGQQQRNQPQLPAPTAMGAEFEEEYEVEEAQAGGESALDEAVEEAEQQPSMPQPLPSRNRGRRPPQQQRQMQPPQKIQPPPAAREHDEDEDPNEVNGNVALPPEDDDDAQHRRRRRGGRGRRGRGNGGTGNNTTTVTSQPPRGALPNKPAPALEPPAPRAAEAATLTRTGSADRHLVNDEPIAPQPASRPRTYRDLDSIPDDFD